MQSNSKGKYMEVGRESFFAHPMFTPEQNGDQIAGKCFDLIRQNDDYRLNKQKSSNPTEAGELQATTEKISDTWTSAQLSESTLDTKVSVAKRLWTTVNNPAGWCVAVVGLGWSCYVVINRWDESSEEVRQENIKLLVGLGVVTVGGTVQGLFNIGTSCFGRLKSVLKQRRDASVEKKGATTVLAILTVLIENYLHHPCSKRVKKNIKIFNAYFATDFPGKNLLSTDLIFGLGQAHDIAKKHLGKVSNEVSEDQDPKVGVTHCVELDDFLRTTIIPLIYMECNRLGVDIGSTFDLQLRNDSLDDDNQVTTNLVGDANSNGQEIEIPMEVI